MNKKGHRKLALSKNTIKKLALGEVAGGSIALSGDDYACNTLWKTCVTCITYEAAACKPSCKCAGAFTGSGGQR
jgi:hypothetical protein